MKDKAGNKLTTSEYMERWKKGIQQITPRQKLKFQLRGTALIMIGLTCGLVISIMSYEKLWWVAIVLVGALMVNGISYVSMRQQKVMLDNIEKQMKSIEVKGGILNGKL